ncbi:MAG: Sulfoxide reductase heme-binding subunit YedZ [Parcubacteria group bacterium]|nr:Sulfoxide reductase heme-binding subunit YedZ [Parcubacteria group bacterium]
MDYAKTHVRSWVYMVSIVIALDIYVFVGNSEVGTLRIIRLEEGFGFVASLYLLLALLPTPLYSVFPSTPGKALYTQARRAIGISTFCFAFLHASISFFGLLDGFAGIPFLDTRYLMLLGCGAIALIILFFLAATSFDIAVRLMGSWWKRLHQFVYLAGVLTFIHVTLLGSHFSDPSAFWPMLFITVAFAFLVLEAARLDKKYVAAREERAPRFSGVFVLCCVILTVVFMILTSGDSALHAGHAGHTSATTTSVTP